MNTKRYNLVLPEELYQEVKDAAEARHTTIIELLKQFIKLGLLVINLEKSSEAQLIIKEGETEKVLILI